MLQKQIQDNLTTFYGSYFWNDRANFPLLKKVANIKMWKDEKWFQGLVLSTYIGTVHVLLSKFYLEYIQSLSNQN